MKKKEVEERITKMQVADITDKDMTAIVSLMDDDIREKVHVELAPCYGLVFLARYLELDPDFYFVMQQEFSDALDKINTVSRYRQSY